MVEEEEWIESVNSSVVAIISSSFVLQQSVPVIVSLSLLSPY